MPVTSREFAEQVAALARGMIAAGVGAGDRVGILSRTRYEWTLADYAIWTTGGVAVPIYETSSAEQAQWILSDSGAVAVVVETADHRSMVESVRADLPGLREVWQIDAGGLDTVAARAAEVPEGELAERRATLSADTLATIIYTSGTTGRPKGCELTHGNLLYVAELAPQVIPAMAAENASSLLFLPLARVFARIIEVGCVENGARLGHTADLTELLADLGTFQPSFLVAVPRVFEKVYNGARQKAHAGGKGAIFDRAERVAVAWSKAQDTGGVGLGLKLQHKLFDALVYGKLRAAMGGRVGRPAPGSAVRITDLGEIEVRGPQVFRGYWNNPDATAESMHDGWFATGDLGVVDDEGYVTITGRMKEVIVTSGGKNTSPAVLEDKIRAHPLVSQCIVVGDNRPFIGCLVTLDAEALPGWLETKGRPTDTPLAQLVDDPEVLAEIQAAVDRANTQVSKAGALRPFGALSTGFPERVGPV